MSFTLSHFKDRRDTSSSIVSQTFYDARRQRIFIVDNRVAPISPAQGFPFVFLKNFGKERKFSPVVRQEKNIEVHCPG